MDIRDKIRLINLPKIEDSRGNLSLVEEETHIPFVINRIYWIYDVPGGEYRGSHAFKVSDEFIIALSGSFDIVLHNGKEEIKYSMNRSYYGLYVPRLTFRRLENFSTNSVALVFSSTLYEESDYVREFNEFLTYVK
jgi:hypothetical protein